MGVPSFYRWLVQKYPKIVSEADEQNHGVDNFYLDMNGIIHACFHPDDDIFPPTSFREVFSRIHDLMDHLFDIVKPRKLLFMAIDGVAPRAKMNQQRSRRFRSSKDAQIAQELEDKLRKQFENEGKTLLPKKESEVADSNIITPGTEFMHILSEDLQYYIKLRMRENQDWGNIKVILSDDKVPGEGEHKIMSFIRAQRSLPGYNPNTRHCLYGLDADLIMLALATHEVHFSILREEILSTNYQSQGSSVDHSRKSESDKSVSQNEHKWMPKRKQHYQLLNVWVLREYLALDLRVTPPKKEFDLERVVNDFIFICFFAGNDFLPHIPSLEIHEGCVDLLMHVYKEEFENLGGYFVDVERVRDKKCGYIKLKRVEKFILSVGAYEDKIFTKRLDMKDRLLKRIIAEYNDAKIDEQIAVDEGRVSDSVCSSTVNRINTSDVCLHTAEVDEVHNNTMELKLKLKDALKKQSDLLKNGDVATDKVKFGKEGWKERYYVVKFNAQSPAEIDNIRKSVVMKYSEGLCWVLRYYFSEVPSWTWYYPYHYGPLASDFKGLAQAKMKFTKGLPFKPFDQLMGVLPPSSAGALPLAYKDLMTNLESCLYDFYPTDFETDLDGKRYTWQGLCKLPFIEEDRLLTATRQLESGLKDHENLRNTTTVDKLFLKCSTEFRQQLHLESGGMELQLIGKVNGGSLKVDCTIEGVKGAVLIPVDFADGGKCCIGDVMCLGYEVREESLHIPRVLEGVDTPVQIVSKDDVVETILWHDYYGSNWNYMKRCQYQRPTKEQSSWKLSPHHPNDPVNDRVEGRGFLFGRGRCQYQSSYQRPTKEQSSWKLSLHHPNDPVNDRVEGRGFSLGRGRSGSNPVCPPYIPKHQYDNQGSGSNPSHAKYVPKFRSLMTDDSGNMSRLSISEANKQKHNVPRSNQSHGQYVPKFRLLENSGNMDRDSASKGNKHQYKALTGSGSARGRGASFGDSDHPSWSGNAWKEACLGVMQERSVQGTGRGQKSNGSAGSARGRGASFGDSDRPSGSGNAWKEACLEVMQERSVQGTGRGQKSNGSGKERGWYTCKN